MTLANVLSDPTVLDAEIVARDLDVDPTIGLAESEAARRLLADGPNELRTKKSVPAWRKVLAQFQDPLIYLLLVAVVISLLAWGIEGGTGVPVDATVIAVIVLLNALLGYTQEAKAEDAVAALGTMTAASSTVLRGSQLHTVPSTELVRGDILVLAEGDAVGADARLLESTSLRIQEASLTGESEAVTKDSACLAPGLPIGDRTNTVFKGTSVVQGVGRAVVTGVAMDTEVGAIAVMLDATPAKPTPLEIEIAKISKMLGLLVIAIAVVVMVTIVLVDGVTKPADLVTVLLLGVSLAVAAVPEGLPTILSLVLAIGVQRLANRNAVVKQLSSVETLGSASVICTDKTGTLTRNEMAIVRVVTASGSVEVTGDGYRPEGAVLVNGSEPLETHRREVELLLAAGSLANDAQLTERNGAWEIVGDPTEAAFLVAAHKLVGTMGRIDRFERRAEIPFTSERKMMTTLHRERDKGTHLLLSKGAPDVLLTHCSMRQVGDATLPLTDATRQQCLDEVEALSSEALRTLGVAYRVADGPTDEPDGLDESAEHDMVYLGVVGIIDPPRPEVAEAITQARRAGIRVVMITGDHPTTATRIAADLGIIESGGHAVTGTELDARTDDDLQGLVKDVSVYARVAPQHKLRIVAALQSSGQIVAMTGDGVNDAPALKAADIGVAMGITGTEVTKEASRMILGDDDFATIVAAVRQGRVIFDNIKKFLRYLLSSNIGEVLTVFLGVVGAGVIGLRAENGEALALPLLATQILWINLVTDSTPALAMGVDPEVDDAMARRPRHVDAPTIDGRMWAGIISTGLVIALVTLFTIDLFLPGGLVEGSDTLTVARTAGFTTLVLAQLFNALNSRSGTVSAFRGMFANWWLWGAIGLGLVLQIAVVELPVLQVAFGTAALDFVHWAACIALASVVLWYEELRKRIMRAINSKRGSGAR